MMHAGADARTLAWARVWVFAIWLSRVIPDCFSCYAAFPPFLFNRLGLLRLLRVGAVPWLLDARMLAAAKVALVALLLLALFGVRPYRLFATAAAVLLTVYKSMAPGLVQPTHVDVALLFVTYVLAVSPAADAIAWRARPRPHSSQPYAAAMIMMTLLLLSTYSLVACHRLAFASPEIFLEPTMRYYVASDILRPTHHPFLLGEWLLVRPRGLALLQLSFPVITLFELASPLCVIHRRLRYLWVAVMVVFHAASYLFMNVLFVSNLLLFPVLLVDRRQVPTTAA